VTLRSYEGSLINRKCFLTMFYSEKKKHFIYFIFWFI